MFSEFTKFSMNFLYSEMIQDEPLLLRVMDYDTYSANDAIGKVSLSLNPLLLQKDISRGMYGWIPIYDTMNGNYRFTLFSQTINICRLF